MDEIWKDVIGYEGLYQVSNLGRVKAFAIQASQSFTSQTARMSL